MANVIPFVMCSRNRIGYLEFKNRILALWLTAIIDVIGFLEVIADEQRFSCSPCGKVYLFILALPIEINSEQNGCCGNISLYHTFLHINGCLVLDSASRLSDPPPNPEPWSVALHLSQRDYSLSGIDLFVNL